MLKSNKAVILLGVLFFLQILFLSLDSRNEQWLLFCLSLIFFIFTFFLTNNNPSPHSNSNELIRFIGLCGSCLLMISVLWNFFFLNYIHSKGFVQDIFRESFWKEIAPIYGNIRSPRFITMLLSLLPVLFLLIIFFTKPKFIFSYKNGFFFFLFSLLTTLFYSIIDNGINSLTEINVHYKTYSHGLPFFDSIGGILNHYTDKIEFLGIHNSHYPPGNLLLLKLQEQLKISGLAKFTVIILGSLSVFPLNGIMKHFRLSQEAKAYVQILFISSCGSVIYSNIDLVPITIFFAISSIFFFTKCIHEKHFYFQIGLGLTIAAFTFFSFSVSLLLILFSAYILIELTKKNLQISGVIISIIPAIGIFMLLYLLLYLFNGFNIYECFINAVKNNSKLMNNGFDDPYRYFIRSTGNLIAYLISIGFVLTGLFIKYILSKENKNQPVYRLSLSVFLTIIIASFSGLFFLETERIWLFFTPLIAIPCGLELQKCKENTVQMIVYSFLLGISQYLFIIHYV